jgi:predicted ABC-class ATPase
MKTRRDFERELQRIDGRGYKAYRDLEGAWDFDGFVLLLDHAQGDPFAAPSRVRVRVDQARAGFAPGLFSNKPRAIGLRDFIARRFAAACRRPAGRSDGGGGGGRGSGKSGLIAIERPGQEILERSSVVIDARRVEARFVVGLPAFGRRVAGRQAREMFCTDLPRIVDAALIADRLDAQALRSHVDCAEDGAALRAQLEGLGLVAFVADGALLPRRSGVDPRPMDAEQAVAFQAPDRLRLEVELPNAGRVTGMGLPRGVTLIAGGGYHGKSTLLEALEQGIYTHKPGDGRELVASEPATQKIRAEDGRRVERVDISAFIGELPLGRSTTAFCSQDASGSTSQAANIIEALAAGARSLLIDEDTSATNFMIRDHRMQQLVAADREPITPFLDKVRQLYDEHGVSSVLVIGGSGDYFDVADRVLCMDTYRPQDVTERARAIAERFRSRRRPEGGERFGPIRDRMPLAASFDPRRGKRPVKIGARGLDTIVFGRHEIELGALEQLVDPGQTRAIGDAIQLATRFMDGRRGLAAVVAEVMRLVDAQGLDALGRHPRGDYVIFRGLELAAAINRLRTLRVR